MSNVGRGKKFARSVSYLLVVLFFSFFFFVIMRSLFLGTKSLMQR